MPRGLQRRAVGYVRVSVDHERKVSPEIQAEAISKLCAAKGWELVHIEVERGRSAGTGKKRPGLDHVREMIRCGEADTLVVWKLDRCSRSVHDFSVLLEELRETRTPGSCRARRASTRRTRWVRRWCRSRWCSPSWSGRGRRSGPWRGMPTVPGAATRTSAGRRSGTSGPETSTVARWARWRSTQTTAPLVRQAAELFLATGSMMAVRRFLGEHGYERGGWTLRRGLGLAAARRHPDRRRRAITGTWPAIFDVETHLAIVAELNKPERGRGRPAGERWLLSGFLVCGRWDGRCWPAGIIR